MRIKLEEFQKKDGFVTIWDTAGMLTIQMEAKNVCKIIDVFDDYIQSDATHDETVSINEFGEDYDFELSLRRDNGGFHLTGIIDESLHRGFELEFCDIPTWEKIKKLCLS